MTGAAVAAPDLRAGSALVLAAQTAEGTSEIEGVYHIDRGMISLNKNLKH